jgi:hypothetical protein
VAKPSLNVLDSLKASCKAVWDLRSEVSQLWVGAYCVDLLVTVQMVPLQGLSLLVMPLFWTLPRMLDLQLALPVAVLEGKRPSI